MQETAQTKVEDVRKAPVQEMTPKPTLYDADAEQRFSFDVEGQYRIAFVFSGLPDEVFEQYDRLREVLVEAEGTKTDINTDSVAADNYFFREVCLDVEGYDGEKPDGWQDLIDYEEKRAAINKILGFKIIENESDPIMKKRKWGQNTSPNTIALKARFDDEIVICKAKFPPKLVGDISLYNSIKSRVSLVEKDLDESAIKIPASMKRKADLFNKLNPQVEGYAGRVPMHHKAAFVTAHFETSISSAEKK